MKFKSLFLVLILLPSLVHAESFYNKNYHFKIDYPSKWIVIEPTKNDQQVIVPIVTLLNKDDPSFPTNIHILTETVQNFTLSSYYDVNFLQIKEYFGPLGLEVQEQGNTTINDNPAFFIQYGWTTQSYNNATLQLVAKQYLLQKDDTFYVITYTQPQESSKVSLSQFEEIISTWQFLDKDTNNVTSSDQPKKGGCLIATAAYGSEFAPQVQQLREVRDNVLYSTYSGSAFMTGFDSVYYTFSPTVADWEKENSFFKEAVKIAITPLVSTLSILNYIDIHSEAEMLAYGFGIILLNTAIYFGVPAFFILNLKHHIDLRNVNSKH